jgi:hypothetical protein
MHIRRLSRGDIVMKESNMYIRIYRHAGGAFVVSLVNGDKTQYVWSFDHPQNAQGLAISLQRTILDIFGPYVKIKDETV